MADSNEVPTGQRFTQVYIAKGVPVRDSSRARHRVLAYIKDFLPNFSNPPIEASRLARFVRREMGVQLDENLEGVVTLQTADFLDFLTVFYCFLHEKSHISKVYKIKFAQQWKDFLDRVIKEEHLSYSLDSKCGIHFSPDADFEINRVSTLSCLSRTRYESVRHAFERARDALDREDTMTLTRSMYEAIETLCKLILESKRISSIGPKEAEKELSELIADMYGRGSSQGHAARSEMKSLADWLTAAQPYRHGQKTEEPAPPPFEIAVLFFSQGASFIRFLVDIDQSTNSE